MKELSPQQKLKKHLTREVWKNNIVSVLKGAFSETSECSVKSCNKHEQYLICLGGTQLSNLLFGACKKHLPLKVDEAYKIAEEQVKKTVTRQIKEDKKKAKELLSQ